MQILVSTSVCFRVTGPY